MIYFGHQSVGADIMRGVTEIAGDQGLDTFVHEPVGRNRDPRSKTDDFARRIDAAPPGTFQVAFHKYCYADIEHGADIEAILAHYREVMDRLRERHPDVRFAHVTVPLQSARPTWRSRVKRMLGRAHGRFADNAARERFNARMRELYAGREPLFDLAAIESTRPDGTAERMSVRGRSAPALVNDYASDGSHLGPLGRRRVAEALLGFLAGLGVPAGGEPIASDTR